MASKIHNLLDYVDYIKCGEILKSPLKTYENPIILKCFECEDIHFLLESFVVHIQEHYKDVLFTTPPTRKRISTRSRNGNKKQEKKEVEDDIFPTENLEIKLEENVAATEMEDPLIGVKDEIDNVKEDVKEETEFEEKKDKEFLNISSDAEHHDDFEEVFVDSADEFNPDDDRPADLQGDTDSEDDESIGESTKKRKRVIKEISPFIETFTLSEENVKTLIEAYKNQPNLWNRDFPHYRNKEKKQQYLQELTDDLNKKQTLNLTPEQTKEIIAHIIGKHRDDHKRLQKHGKKGKKEKKYKTVWYFEHLEFLRPKVKIQLQTLDSQQPDLTPEQIIQILDIYKEHPHLWNSNLIEYICSNKRQEAHSSMLQMLETKMNLKITKNVLEVYINTIHKYFSKEKPTEAKSAEEETDSTKTPDNYFEHMKFLYDHEGPFSCSECNTVHSKPLLFRIHKSQHNNLIPFKCSLCSKELKTIPSYTSHAKRHYEDFEYPCTECERRFFNQQELKIHLMTHTGAQPYCCEICGASFRYVNSLKKHQRRHRGQISHTCHICSKGFYSKYRYNDHINSHLGIRQFICKVCSKAFITSRALKTHMVTHDDARNHACSLCGKTFKLKIGVLQHMRTHGNNIGIDDKC